MQPEHGVRAAQASELFEAGRWEELEGLLQANLASDPSDARSAFRLANLLMYRARFREALPLYDLAWTQRWPGALCLSNKGVALACLGETRAAFKAFSDAGEECRPALYNLAILLEKVGDEGALPDMIVDLQLGERDKAGSALALEKLDEIEWPGAAENPWANTGADERPLFLWHDDLPPGFGFEPVERVVSVAAAYELFEEGLALLDRQQWEAAIAKLESAADLHPQAFAQRILAPRTRAQVAIARVHLAEVKRLWDGGSFDEASQVFDELLAHGSTLPERAFAEIVEAAIHDLAQRVRSHQPADGWEPLQKLITAARQRIEARGDAAHGTANGAAPPAGGEPAVETAGDAATPADEPADSGARELDPDAATSVNAATAATSGAGEYLRSVCRGAWSKQINHLLSTGNFDAAAELLEFPEIAWFAGGELPHWRQQVYTAKAETLRARARDALARQDWPAAATAWAEGRDAARLAKDARVVDSFDNLRGELRETLERHKVPPDQRREVETVLRSRDDLVVLKQAVKELKARPADQRLDSRVQAALAELLSSVEAALAAGQFAAARALTEQILEVVPDSAPAMSLRRQAEQALVDSLLTQAADALARGLTDPAMGFCDAATELGADAARLAPLRRDIQARAARSQADQGADGYRDAYAQFAAARARGDHEEALTAALEMKRFDSRAPQTREALDWLPAAYVEALRVKLESDRTEGTIAAIQEKLKRLFYLQPGCPPARELSRELRQSELNYAGRRRQASDDALTNAEELLLRGDPVAALEKLQAVSEPDLAAEAAAIRADAIDLLARQIDPLLVSPAPDDRAKASELLDVCRRWAPQAAEARQQQIDARRQQAQFEAGLDARLTELERLLRDNARRPFRALRQLDHAVRQLELEGVPLREHRRQALAALRQRILRSMTPLPRAAAWLYDRYYSTDPRPPRIAAAGGSTTQGGTP